MPSRNPGGIPPMIGCRTCHRAIWSNHVDENGNCVFCAEPQPVAVEPVEEPVAPAEVPPEA